MHHVVGGFSLPGLPAYLNQLDYVCWIATTLKEEWAGRYSWSDLSIRNIPSHLNAPFLPLIYRLEKAILERAKHVFALSEYTAQCMRRDLGLQNPNVEVMPYLIDTECFSPHGPRALAGEDYILLCGRADDSRKNIPLMLRAFAEVRARFPRVKLVIAGTEPHRRAVWQVLEDLKLREAVRFLGDVPRRDLPGYYRGAKLKVLSSTQEGLAIVLLEAMACGVPVVSTRCGGPEEIVEHRKTGLLVENHNAGELAEAVCRLLSDEAERAAMGAASRERALEMYSIQQRSYPFVQCYRRLYPAVMGIR